MSTSVRVLGDVTVDLTLRIGTYPREGGDAFAAERRMATGGCGANVAITLARMGLSPHVVATVGDDVWGQQAIAALASEGVGTETVSRDPVALTHLTVIIVSGDAERTMIGHSGASALVGTAPLVPPVDALGALVVSGYALFTSARARQALRLISAAHDARVPVVLDLPAELPPAAHDTVRKAADGVRVLVTGTAAISALTGRRQPARAAESACGPHRQVIVTLGPGGCLSVGPDGEERVPGMAVRAVDTTGAGDAFVAAYLAGWLGGLGLRDALALATAFGAAATLSQGTGTSLPRPADVWRDFGPQLPSAAATWLRSVRPDI
ncbi:ribokinase [Micromonospora viridifaciens]|uniref:Ribokinase n=1 Tax=Micromonospora viridifaciens TaxID=1881 RepID=A0A1C4YNI0_MICVI|nr:carbohydrate kinase family protein [Micromonospora viridifaciens]SCF22244.1 ribokinase [Micromonospora viridifaciens]